MNEVSRKDFLKAAGAGSAVLAAGIGLPLTKHLIDRSGRLTFSASAGVPQAPLPGYATHVVDGIVDLERGTGVVTTRLVAGHPGDPGVVGLPGLQRVIRITSVDTSGRELRLQGRIEDRSQLQRGESPDVEIVVDARRRIVTAPFVGHELDHLET